MAKDKKTQFNKAIRSLNAIEVYYAKIICNFSNEARLKIFRKIASLMRNRFSLMDALDMLHDGITNGGKNPSEPMAIALASWGKALQNEARKLPTPDPGR